MRGRENCDIAGVVDSRLLDGIGTERGDRHGDVLQTLRPLGSGDDHLLQGTCLGVGPGAEQGETDGGCERLIEAHGLDPLSSFYIYGTSSVITNLAYFMSI